MDNVLPSGIPGLDINGVIYNYTINKNTQDSVSVYIQNERANGNGYIFREKDDWLPGSLGGTQINKAVPVVPSNRVLWGDGSIVTEGQGSVSSPRVVYTYRVDPCYDPQFDPNCPGYQVPTPPVVELPDPSLYEVNLEELYDATKDENVDLDREACKTGDTDAECKSTKKEDEEEVEEEKEETKEEKEKRLKKEKAEKALAAKDKSDAITFFAQNNAMFAQAIAQNAVLQSMQTATNMNAYYGASIPGGVYNESVVLVDKQLPENRRGLRNGLAQQLLHEKMIEMQYKK